MRHNTDEAETPGTDHALPSGTVGRAILTGAILLIAIGHVFRPHVFDEFVTLLLLTALSPWVVPFFSHYLRSVEAFGGKVEFLEDKVKRDSDRLDELYLLSMSDKVFEYLRKLSRAEGFGPFYISPAMPRELGYLEDLGYIRFKGDLRGLDDFLIRFDGKPDGGNLSEHIALTTAGETFTTLREKAHLKSTGRRAPQAA